MNIILLSGGSGKRLWPISNDIRSKQFIKLFKNNKNDEYESMIQRIYDQIKNVDKESVITIATSKNQVPYIRNQLGDKVEISLEPFRRDTFPAIALATSYLKDIKKIPEDETVIVCPVDPYVDEQYFKSLQKLEMVSKKSKSNLTLMGIKPTCASEKFGYIIPKDNSEVSEVLTFKEKPNKELAEEYIKQNALWNGGVFAFKLKYLMDVAHKLIDFSDYEDLFNKYESLTKISFDYAVVEKENNINVVRFSGKWEDLGTWNSLTEVLNERIIGNGLLSEDCNNTNIINELDIPVLGIGLENIVVGVSEDGILVSEKDKADGIKRFVDNFKYDPKIVEKNWGMVRNINYDSDSNIDMVVVKKGNELEYKYKDDEKCIILSGDGVIKINHDNVPIEKGNILPNSDCLISAKKDVKFIKIRFK